MVVVVNSASIILVILPRLFLSDTTRSRQSNNRLLGTKWSPSCYIMTIVQTKEMALSADYIRTSLQNLYGESVTTGDLRAWCAMNGTTYATVTKKLEEYKVGRGKWNLEVTKETVKDLEVTYNSPAISLLWNKISFLKKMIPSSSLVISLILKKLLSPVYSIQRSLRVFLVTAKRSRLNKRVPNSDVN